MKCGNIVRRASRERVRLASSARVEEAKPPRHAASIRGTSFSPPILGARRGYAASPRRASRGGPARRGATASPRHATAGRPSASPPSTGAVRSTPTSDLDERRRRARLVERLRWCMWSDPCSCPDERAARRSGSLDARRSSRQVADRFEVRDPPGLLRPGALGFSMYL